MHNTQVYAVFSAHHLQLNARFVKQTFFMGGICKQCIQKTVCTFAQTLAVNDWVNK